MPILRIEYEPALYETVDQLTDWMIRANAWGVVTKNQGKAVVQKLTPMLPVTASLSVRTKKSMLYIHAGGTFFRIGQRGQVIDRPWNPNPRRAPRNPWAD